MNWQRIRMLEFYIISICCTTSVRHVDYCTATNIM